MVGTSFASDLFEVPGSLAAGLLCIVLALLCAIVMRARKASCVVVADDFGISLERSRGIVLALKGGVVTCTSVMANGDAAVEAIEMAREHGLLHLVGLHLNLTEGRPVSDPSRVPSLLLEEGETQSGTELKGGPLLRGKMGYRTACASGAIRAEDAAEEALAQLRWFEKHVGRMPHFVDGHQHCHVVPAVREQLASVFAAAGVRHTRIPTERKPPMTLCPLCSVVDVEAEQARATFSAHGISSCAGFVGLSLCGVDYSPDELVNAVATQLRHGARSCEVMVHPGLPDSDDNAAQPAWDDFGRCAPQSHPIPGAPLPSTPSLAAPRDLATTLRVANVGALKSCLTAARTSP